MKTWDLTAGAGKLELAMDSLRAAGAEVEQSWDDEAFRKFQETYITPLEPKVQNFLDALQRLNEVLTDAERQCGMDSYES
jgi:hypothetical protein